MSQTPVDPPVDSRPLVSVVLPTYNRAQTLGGAIRSVLAQSFADFELLVVDDASTDDTAQFVRTLQDPRIRYLRREKNGGVAAARNTGVGAATGELVAFQDSDDEWLPGKLARQVSVLGEGRARMAICGLVRRSPEGVERVYPESRGAPRALTHREVLTPPIAYTQTWLVRRRDVLEAGGFDESLRVWDDWELLIRLSRLGPAQLDPEIFVVSPMGPTGISRERERFIHDMGRVLEKHAADLRAYPREHAQLHYLYGRLLAADGHVEAARAAFTRALRMRPTHWRAAALLTLSFAGAAPLKRVLDPPRNPGTARP